MLYGNIIFIKKTGGDGSKYPVTERDIKIGRSEECLIRIYNPQVAPEHCQLLIEENGQAVLRNLSNQTILNGKALGHKDVVLCHGDIFKLGERLARWEYLPTSKYYRQLLSPTGRLVAVVMPQQRPLGEQATPKASASQVTISKNTPLRKRRYSERTTTESSAATKIRKSSGLELICKTGDSSSKFETGRHSLKTTKLIMKGGKPKERKSFSGIPSSKKGKALRKSRKSTLPLWKVNIASPPRKISSASRSSVKKSAESVKSPKSIVTTSSEDIKKLETSDEYLSASKTLKKTPSKALIDFESSGEVLKSASKSVLNIPIKTLVELPSNSGRRSSRSTILSRKSFSHEIPSLKTPSNLILSTPGAKSSKLARSVHSESKIRLVPKKRSSFALENPKINSALKTVASSPNQKSLSVNPEKENSKMQMLEVISDKILQPRLNANFIKEAHTERKTSPRKSSKNTPAQKTSRISGRIKESSLVKTPRSAQKFEKVPSSPRNAAITPTRGSDETKSRGPGIRCSKKFNLDSSEADTPLIKSNNISSPKISSCVSSFVGNTPAKKTPSKSTKNSKITPSSSPTIAISENETPVNQHKPSVDKGSGLKSVEFLQRKHRPSKPKTITNESSSFSESKITSPRGIQRKLSPSSSAERAAKKLKTSSPRKPDKNKKAALLVLGKANRTHLMSQNVKVLLKQKIVKKALKQTSSGSGNKDKRSKKTGYEVKQGRRKNTKTVKNKKQKKFVKKVKSNEEITLPSKTLEPSDASAISFKDNNAVEDETPKSKRVLQGIQLSASKLLQTPSRFSSKSKFIEDTSNSLSKEKKTSEIPGESKETISPFNSFEKNAENYLLNSFRRCSKRLSSKNDTGRPDFVELSPTALGLMPKNWDIFKTPKDKRRSSSLVTPKNIRTSGIIKSASTSKVGGRKSVRFSPKDMSYNSVLSSPNSSDKNEFDFSSFQTPNITTDVFVSPLSEKSSATKRSLDDSELLLLEKENSKSWNKNSRNSSERKLGVRKLLHTPQSKKNLDVILTSQNDDLHYSKTPAGKSISPVKASCEDESSENLNDFKGVQQFFETPKTQKSPKKNLSDSKETFKYVQNSQVKKNSKNESTDLIGAKEHLQTSMIENRSMNELSDVRGVKKLLRTPRAQKSPKNDLSDVRGVKKLLRTPKIQKSPKNDLSDVRGVKKLLITPKTQKSPKNDLSDVRGVKKLLRTPKAQKSPKNDLSDVRGVKKLLRTPRAQKSPKNDLSDVRGVKKLLRTPKIQKSPKNDLSDVRGVKKLLRTPKTQKGPKNDLSDVRGVKKLLGTPKVPKSPKNDLSDVRGVKKLLRTPKIQKSPRNDLSDVRGVKKLLGTPKVQKSPRNDLSDVSGMVALFKSPTVLKVQENSAESNNSEKVGYSPQSEEIIVKNLINTKKSPENISRERKPSPKKSRVSDLRAVRGRRAIHLSSKGPKNDLSDLTGVRELFLRNQPINERRASLTGVAELFNFPDSDIVPKKRAGRNVKKQVSEMKSLRSRKVVESENGEDEIMKIPPRRTRSRMATEKTTEKTTRYSKAGVGVAEERKPPKRKAPETVKTNTSKKASVAKKSKETSQRGRKTGEKIVKLKENDSLEVKNSRKRNISLEDVTLSPPKLRRKLRETASKDTPTIESRSEEKIPVKRVQKVSAKRISKKKSEVSPKVQKKTTEIGGTKQSQKVQSKRSQTKLKNTSSSKENISPRKTRSVKTKASARKVTFSELTPTESLPKSLSPVVQRSTRRKLK